MFLLDKHGMDGRLRAIVSVISLLILLPFGVSCQELDLLEAQETLINAGIAVDLESSHIEDLKVHVDLPAAFKRVLESLHEESETCDPSEPYRRADGVCNNLESPLHGAVLQYQQRLLPNAYMDGRGIPRLTGTNDKYLASARTVSVECFPASNETNAFLEKTTTRMSMQWGQYLDHDVVSTEVMSGEGCCDDPIHSCVHPDSFSGLTCVHPDAVSGGPCFPIPINDDDRFFNESCMNFKRSFSIVVDAVHEQINGVTSFVDASTVYGSNQALQDQLRAHVGGLLKTSDEGMLPHQGHFKCRKALMDPKYKNCPNAGDPRVNVFPGLTSLHLLFVREHNRLAKKLAAINPHWNDERLFQETRRIIVAYHQAITYEEYLSHVVGPAAIDYFRLDHGNFQYDPELDPGILNEFGAAAFRFGHSQLNSDLKTDRLKPISELFFQPWEALNEENLRSILRNQCSDRVQKANQFITPEVTDKLFLDVDALGHSTDLGARNVQRGRDHGIPPYIEYLDLAVQRFINATQLNYGTFQQPECLNTKAYDSISDVDLYVGGLYEQPIPGGLVGPTFAFIIAEQFRRIKFGDRYFWETEDPVVGFTPEQSNAVGSIKLAHIICQNSETERLQLDVFHVVNDELNPLKECSEFLDIDLSAWKEV